MDALVRYALWAWIALGVGVLPVIFLKTAPYGRHTPNHARCVVPSRVGWLVMEAPSAFVVAWFFVAFPPHGVVPFALLVLWQVHYVHRAFVYPFRLRAGAKPMPLVIVASAFAFTSINGFFQGYQLTHGDYATFARDPRFGLGVALFVAGFAINQHSDQRLFALRRPGEGHYAIPRGGLFRWVSCPNYLGEIIEWTGFAVASWSLAGASFALWTVANLLPRAVAHHRWYRATFVDYPAERRALIPFLL